MCDAQGQCNFPFNLCVVHPFKKHKSQNIFCQIWYVTRLLYIENLSQFHTILQLREVFQELNHEWEIPKFHI